MTDGLRHYARQRTLTPAEVGLNGVDLSAERTSSIIGCEGYTHLTLHIILTRSAATEVEISYDTRVRQAGTNTTYSGWCPIQGATQAASGDTATDVERRKLLDLVDNRTVAASDNWSTTVEVNAEQVRVRITSTSGDTSDTVLVWATLSCR